MEESDVLKTFAKRVEFQAESIYDSSEASKRNSVLKEMLAGQVAILTHQYPKDRRVCGYVDRSEFTAQTKRSRACRLRGCFCVFLFWLFISFFLFFPV